MIKVEVPAIDALVVKAPGGAGKTEIVRTLPLVDQNFEKVVRHTTRIKSEREQSGTDYHFVNHSEFHGMIIDDQLIEYSQFEPGYYGTSKRALYDVLDKGKVPIFDMDPNAAIVLEAFLSSQGLRFRSFHVVPIQRDLFFRPEGVSLAAEELFQRMVKRSRKSDQGIKGAMGRRDDAIEWYKRVKPEDDVLTNLTGAFDSTIENLLFHIYNGENNHG